MSITNQQLAEDYELTSPEAHAVATAWVKSAKGFKKSAPAEADLAEMITGIGADLTMQGAPQLEIDLYDPNWSLLDSGFFDPSDTGKLLDNVRINYPSGSRYWWRLFQFTPSSDFTVKTYWIPRVVADLMSLKGPFSASRASRTRAEFLKMCADKVPYAHFYSTELDIKQPIAASAATSSSATSSPSATSGPRVPAVGGSSGAVTFPSNVQSGKISWFGGPGDPSSGPTTASGAPVSEPAVSTFNQSTLGGWWLFKMPNGRVAVAKQNDIGPAPWTGRLMDFTYTILPLLGYSQGNFPTDATIQAAYLGKSVPPQYASLVIAPTGSTVAAGSPATTGTSGTGLTPAPQVQQYNFTIGTTQTPHEDYWTGMNRLAQEVNWELVVDGDDIYYDSDGVLAKMTFAATIDRDDEAVATWTYDWDAGAIATNFQLVLECDPFEFRAADVFKLTSFGPASNGSSIGLPGRWLVGEIQRNPGDIVSTFTLVQPTKPLPEPAPQVTSSTAGGAGGSSIVGAAATGSVQAAIQASQALSNLGLPYVWGGNHGAGDLANAHPTTGFDCSSSTSWVLHQAGMFPSDTAIVSGGFESWGAPGPGQEMTVWANSGHVFIQFVTANTQMNTSGGGNGPRYFPWGSNGAADAASGAFTARHFPGT